jgi:hypothetical protein
MVMTRIQERVPVMNVGFANHFGCYRQTVSPTNLLIFKKNELRDLNYDICRLGGNDESMRTVVKWF